MNKQEIMSALQAELNRQFDLGVMTTFVDADGRVMLCYPISHPAPRPVIDVETLADVVCLYNGGTYRTVCDKLVAMVRHPVPSPALFCQQYGRARRPPVMDCTLSDAEIQELIRAGAGEVVILPAADPDFAEVELCGGSDICFAIGSAVRRRNRSQPRGDQPIGSSMEYAATDLVLQALAECGYKVLPPGQESTADSADHLCKLALAEVIEECDRVRAELKATGHAHEGRPLHQLVDAAIDAERERRQEVVERHRRFEVAIREAYAEHLAA